MTRRWIEALRGEPTNMIGYLVGDTTTRTTGVIDPVLETHDNADRLSAAPLHQGADRHMDQDRRTGD